MKFTGVTATVSSFLCHFWCYHFYVGTSSAFAHKAVTAVTAPVLLKTTKNCKRWHGTTSSSLFASEPSMQVASEAGDAKSSNSLLIGSNNDNQRRNFIVVSCAAAVTATVTATAAAWNGEDLVEFFLPATTLKENIPATTTESSGSTDATSSSGIVEQVQSVDQAIHIIESSCDRRFLHAVVASDYKFMYRGITSNKRRSLPLIAIRDETDSLLMATSSGDAAAVDRSAVFEFVQEQLLNRPLQPSNSRLAIADSALAAQGSSRGYQQPDDAVDVDVYSVWPLGDNVHFAWMEEGTAFRSLSSTAAAQQQNINNIIVDGIDCGRMSLEDALENCKEILFRSDRYLAIPLALEKELVAKLQKAFII